MSTLMSELRTTTMRFSPLFFFNDTATTEIYTLSLHDALPISPFPQNFRRRQDRAALPLAVRLLLSRSPLCAREVSRSEEHTSELQSQSNLVCRLLLEKKNHLRRNRTALLRTDRWARHHATDRH